MQHKPRTIWREHACLTGLDLFFFSFLLLFLSLDILHQGFQKKDLDWLLELHCPFNNRKLWTLPVTCLLSSGGSLSRHPLSGTTFLLTSNASVLSHSSKLLKKTSSLLLLTLNYSNPFTGIGKYSICIDLSFLLFCAADIITDW